MILEAEFRPIEEADEKMRNFAHKHLVSIQTNRFALLRRKITKEIFLLKAEGTEIYFLLLGRSDSYSGWETM